MTPEEELVFGLVLLDHRELSKSSGAEELLVGLVVRDSREPFKSFKEKLLVGLVLSTSWELCQ